MVVVNAFTLFFVEDCTRVSGTEKLSTNDHFLIGNPSET